MPGKNNARHFFIASHRLVLDHSVFRLSLSYDFLPLKGLGGIEVEPELRLEAKRANPSIAADDMSCIHDFLSARYKKDQKNYTYFLHIIEDFYLFNGKGILEITDQECNSYFDYLERVHIYRGYSDRSLQRKVTLLVEFIQFLNGKGVSHVDSNLYPEKKTFKVLPEKSNKVSVRQPKPKKERIFPAIIEDFLLYLENHNYRVAESQKRIVAFQKFLKEEGIDIRSFYERGRDQELFRMIERYESMLVDRVSIEEIQMSSVTLYLRTIQLFVKFLLSNKLVAMKYTIPLHLRGKGDRSNEFVPREDVISLANNICECSRHVERDLAIFLIIVDTGCRTIEVCNLTMQDIDTKQRTLSFECKKTNKRTIQISIEVMEVLKDYLDLRVEYSMETDHVFSDCSGQPATPRSIYFHFL